MGVKETIKYNFGTKIIEHPNGFTYKVAFLDESRDLGHSQMLWCINSETGALMDVDPGTANLN